MLPSGILALVIVLAIIAFLIFAAAIGFYFYLRNRVKKVSGELKLNYKIPFPPDLFINAFGGKKNIIKTEATINKVTVFIKDNKLINHAIIQELKPSGIMEGTKKISLILGNYSKPVSKIINNILNVKL